MASAWGNSWGSAWGNSWGSLVVTEEEAVRVVGGYPVVRKKKRRHEPEEQQPITYVHGENIRLHAEREYYAKLAEQERLQEEAQKFVQEIKAEPGKALSKAPAISRQLRESLAAFEMAVAIRQAQLSAEAAGKAESERQKVHEKILAMERLIEEAKTKAEQQLKELDVMFVTFMLCSYA